MRVRGAAIVVLAAAVVLSAPGPGGRVGAQEAPGATGGGEARDAASGGEARDAAGGGAEGPAEVRQERVDELLNAASAVWARGDLAGVLELFEFALRSEPRSVEVHVSRAVFLEAILEQSGAAPVREQLEPVIRADLAFLLDTVPQSRAGGVARDLLAKLEDRQLLAPQTPPCSEAAEGQYGQAEELFGLGRYAEALPHYRRATELCPGSAEMWIHHADAHYALGRLERARELFARGLEHDPWHRSGRRFLADTHAALGDWTAAYRELVLAVLGDPTYEAGWASLQAFTEARGGTFRRVHATKPAAGAGLGTAGRPQRGGRGPVWLGYALGRGAAKPGGSALEAEREAVRAGLGVWRGLGDQRPEQQDAAFWALLDEAEKAGFLDEAIFVHLLDEPLVPEYRAYRDAQRERLLRYVQTLVAPVPPEGLRPEEAGSEPQVGEEG